MVYESFSPAETRKIAFELGKKADRGSIYCLHGDLSAGKTVFTQGFAKGLDIDEYVTSPTFTIINEYNGRLKLYHFDVYRISSIEEMDDTGYEDYFFSDGVCLIEWAELIYDIIPKNAVHIKIEKNYLKGDDYRTINIDTNN